MMASPGCSVLPCHPSGLIPFPFGFSPCPLGLSAFFFPVFLLEKFMRSEAEQTTTGSREREKRT
ncbi:hypothetical protein M2T70_16455 [Elizabethkingia anophelis]|uniref:hypothetical protein n=1 Tax=Elizabethkingia anophelis TaxID=1117645 RepID=UPI0020124ADA|nr:hypothetical protein [Elizabethkingia anophelis]MCL1650554.1 hypothetical protein [Elizabethkingia anophelis]MCL1682566.1 hypothetical protein [Elizabethkingia anophelis]